MTPAEQQLLDALAGTGWRTPGNLIAERRLPPGRSPRYWHGIALDCVRKGWADRTVLGRQTHYAATRDGRKALALRECPACATPPDGVGHTCGLKGLPQVLPLGRPA